MTDANTASSPRLSDVAWWLKRQRYAWGYRLRYWRCWLFGHAWGREETQYEIGYRHASWVACERCGFGEVTWSVYGGQTRAGREIEATQIGSRLRSGTTT